MRTHFASRLSQLYAQINALPNNKALQYLIKINIKQHQISAVKGVSTHHSPCWWSTNYGNTIFFYTKSQYDDKELRAVSLRWTAQLRWSSSTPCELPFRCNRNVIKASHFKNLLCKLLYLPYRQLGGRSCSLWFVL